MASMTGKLVRERAILFLRLLRHSAMSRSVIDVLNLQSLTIL